MRYVSTRGEGAPLDFTEVMLAGLARDGGLYVPESWPSVMNADIAGLAGRPYAEVAVEVMRPFVGASIPEADLARMAQEAYGSFRHPATVPLIQLNPSLFVLELFHGPTLAFKDLAMQLVARLMDHALEQRGQRTTIVVATSGDTGGAAVEAFRGRAQVDVVVLFPQGRISEVQRRMMTTAPDANVHAVAVEGTFDDCQALVKAMFNHHAFRDRVRLSGVNSINWARIVAQAVYYFTAAVALGAPHRKVAFTVPTGNFGDVYAGYVAAKMGLPIDRLVVATNVNDILARTFATGTYDIRDVVATSSPSMDIQISSNFERYLFEASDRDADFVRSSMTSLIATGSFELGRTGSRLKQDFAAVSASEADVADAIRRTKAAYGYVLDPHTACAFVAAERVAPKGSTVVLSTAHPAKFPDAIEAITGERPPLPPHQAHLMSDAEKFDTLPNSLSSIQNFVLKHCRVATGTTP